MEIIAIEGIDKSGKKSQCDLLVEWLKSEGLKVSQSEFHRYDTPTGKLIQEWLFKEYDVDQKTIELIMAADKYAQQKWFSELESEGYDALVLDRYTASQYAYSVANGIRYEWINNILKDLRKPTLQILIDTPVELSMSRKGKYRDGTNDRYESDYAMLERVRGNYFLLTYNHFSNFSVVSGEPSIDGVHSAIKKVVQERLFSHVKL